MAIPSRASRDGGVSGNEARSARVTVAEGDTGGDTGAAVRGRARRDGGVSGNDARSARVTVAEGATGGDTGACQKGSRWATSEG